MQKWKTLSPSAHLISDPECGARGIVRDTRASGENRFLWSVIPFGQLDPIAEGRMGDLARARSIAEVALNAYLEDLIALSSSRHTTAIEPLGLSPES